MAETKEMKKFNSHKQRTLRIATYILEGKTIREVAKILKVSKSTVHYDIKNRLMEINPYLYKDVDKKLQENYKLKHMRGGYATKRKYEEKRERSLNEQAN